MKTFTLIKWFFIVMIIFPIFSCSVTDSDNSNETGTVEISIDLSDTNVKSIGLSSLKTSEVVIKSVVISMTKKDGTVVYDKESISLLNMNGYYIASPISLNVGEYALTEFLVMDDSNNVVYVAPLAGSEKAYLVKTPLSINFEVKKDEVLKLVPEVVSVGNSIPSDFGYSTISFDVVPHFDFSLSAFIYNSTIQNWELSTATILIENEGNVLYDGNIGAITNVISIRDDVSTYNMTIAKPGYKTYIYSFSHDSLQYYKINDNNEPLKIILVNDSEEPIPAHEYITVEGGTFQMGDENGIGQSDELPIHTVTVSSFQVSKYEVTQAQFIGFLNDIKCNSDGSYVDSEYGNVTYINMDESFCPLSIVDGKFDFKGSINVPTIECPAIGITWYGANAYCKWAGGRLPYEAEWEFAARGGNLSDGYKYSGSNIYDDVAWNQYNSEEYAHPVGKKLANELGIYDMSGNVWEWCADWYDVYDVDSQTNPIGAISGDNRVGRGAGYLSNDLSCRVANRHDNNPDNLITYRGHGIRIVKSIN
ncbi:formylglycine-generating enzyme family protein [Labilibaculum manganireducens]|nr:SUMF1/EgtB/PvdO family nonheme iron enzyme [Labilibaculum manganireducens]